jgi:L-asparaginase II
MSRTSQSSTLSLALVAVGTTDAKDIGLEDQDWALCCPEEKGCVLGRRFFVEGVEQGGSAK